MENRQEIIRIIKKYRDTEYLDLAADEILRLFSVVGQSEQLLCYLCKKNKVEVEDDLCYECSKDFE